MRMKLINKQRILLGNVTLTIVLMIFAQTSYRVVLGIWCVLMVSLSYVYTRLFLKKLEHGIDLISEQEICWKYLEETKEPLLIKFARKESELAKQLEKQYNVKVEDRQSKINSLQSQINPHFLYNTLECIRSEALCDGCMSIANMAKSLASFFRYSISRKENIVSIQDELNNIQNYIMIQNYRFDNKYQFKVCYNEEDRFVLKCLIPKMTLQPIVENSVFHGLETVQGNCCVTIKISTTQDKILLTISDNGCGMNEQSLMSLRRKISEGDSKKDVTGNDLYSHGNGVALYNINQRLKLLFGESYGLHVYSVEGEGTDMEVLCPIKRELNEL